MVELEGDRTYFAVCLMAKTLDIHNFYGLALASLVGEWACIDRE
jgi:hypothetical protein